MEEEAGDYRQWDELIPEVLGLIFKKLSLKDILTVIPSVCKAWEKAVQGPYCWQEIDIDEWSIRCKPEQLNRMLRLLITRSSGSLRSLRVSCVNDDEVFGFIAEHAGSLQTLVLWKSDVSDSIVEHVADKLKTITSLDLSYCRNIGTRTLEAIGQNCNFLSSLSWKMNPRYIYSYSYNPSHAGEAHAIATSMPKLKRLELGYSGFRFENVMEILSGCPELEYLDLMGCEEVELDEKLLKKKHPKVQIECPFIMGRFDSLEDFVSY